MTVQTDISRSGPYAGAGTTGPFTVDFRFLADSHLRVIKTSAANVDTDLALTTDYTVSGAGAEAGAVTTIVAVPVGESITIIRDVPFTQDADYVNNDAFPAESHEQALDLLTMQTQQVKEVQGRAIALPPTANSDAISTELPLPVANNILGWNSAADGLANVDPSSLAGIISFGSFIPESFNGTGAQLDFPLTENPLIVGNMDVSVAGVTQRGYIDFTLVPPNILRFTVAPPVGVKNIYIRYGQAISAGEATAVAGQTPFGTTVIQAVSADSAGLVDKVSAQTISGIKTFSTRPIIGTAALGTNDTSAASTGFVQLSSSGRLIGTVIINANGVYAKATNNPSYIIIEVWGGGGGGGGVSGGSGAAGGGAGGYSRKKILAAALAASETVTIGAGGAGGTTAPTAGSTGGTTSFGAHAQATGGAGGAGVSIIALVSGGAGGVGSGGDLNLTGNAGFPNGANVSGYSMSGAGGDTSLGGSGAGLTATFATAGANAVSNSGSGGGGAVAQGSAAVGGNGGSGRVIIYEYT